MTQLNVKENYEEPEMIDEDLSMRKSNAKYYRMSDGSYKAVIFSEPVHYYDENEGKYKEVDNNFFEEGAADESDFDGYVKRKGDLTVKVAKEIGDSETIAVEKGIHKLSWKFKGTVDLELSGETAKKHKAGKLKKSNIRTNSKRKKISDILNEYTNKKDEENEIIFTDAIQGSDLQCVLRKNELKENIIIKEKSKDYKYLFELNTKN